MPRMSNLCVTSSLALPLCLLLSACGGDGASVASIPPPPVTPTPTPTPTPASALPAGTVTYQYAETNPVDVQRSWLNSPATRSGTYELMGRLMLAKADGGDPSFRQTMPSEFSMAVSNLTGGGLSYSLNAPGGILPVGLTTSSVGSPQISWDINSTVAYRYTNIYGDTPQYLGERLAGFSKAANGSENQLFSYDFTRGGSSFLQAIDANTNAKIGLGYDIGYSYVAMGEWLWDVVDPSDKLVHGTSLGTLLFVNGDRTSAAGIPVSGTATYDARGFNSIKVPFALTADFGLRTISTLIDQALQFDPSVDDYPSALGIHVGGTAPFSNDGLFDIPLTGTMNFASNTPATTASATVTGEMNGAFFGPHAEQVGGTLYLQDSAGTQQMQDAFVGQQHQP